MASLFRDRRQLHEGHAFYPSPRAIQPWRQGQALRCVPPHERRSVAKVSAAYRKDRFGDAILRPPFRPR